MTISLVLEGWDWSLFTFSQSVTFSKSEFISLASATESYEEAKIWVSSAYRQDVDLQEGRDIYNSRIYGILYEPPNLPPTTN